MKKRLALTLIASLIVTNSVFADFAFTEASDYTGEAFFESPTPVVSESKPKESTHTIPPIKKARLFLKSKLKQRENAQYELAPTASDIYAGEIETSDYASKEIEDDFEQMVPDGFEADEEAVAEENERPKRKLFRKKNKTVEIVKQTDDIILDCDNVDYDTPNYLIHATGNVSVVFVQQGSTLKADVITFNRIDNTIKAEGNVKIYKSGQVITGDYIFVDMNEENALIENPMTNTGTIEIKSKKGYVYGDRIVQEDGSVTVDKSYPIEFASGTRGPRTFRMLRPKTDNLSDDIEQGVIKLKAKDIKITQKGDLEIIALKKPHVFKSGKTLIKLPAIKLYTNKNRDFVETNIWEIGSYRGLGLYTGPGFVLELPKGSVLKAIPMLNYKSGFGIGAVGRYSSGTNQTMLAYGSAIDKFIAYGKQDLDDHLYLQYGMNSYFNEWFMGRRRPKYGASLVYENGYASKDFLLKGQTSSFKHRFDAGYYNDMDYDSNFEKIRGNDLGTTRFRYMAQVNQNFYSYVDEEKMKMFTAGLVGQFSSAIYGTGDTQVVGRGGPSIHMQYKRWMQDLSYYFTVYDDNTPMPVYDAYRYGKQTLYLREYFRINKYLTLAWFAGINMSNDARNGKDFQENSFYLVIGPDDVKLNLGYDFVRENLYCTMQVMMDAKGAKVEYDTLEIKQDKKAKKEEKTQQETSSFEPSTQPPVLQRATVENVKVMEDVL